jgi:hypothetical protein
MSLFFAQAALWPILALVTLPIAVHLFARARPQPLPFSSIVFLQRVVRRTSLLQRPRSWLILILRTLLVLALLLMVLQPVWRRESPLAGIGARREVVIVIDQSASMGAVEGVRSRLATAAARASEILESLRPQDLANIVWARTPARAEFPKVSVNKNALRKALADVEVTSEAADISAALTLAAAQFGKGAADREIHILSDFQPATWDNWRPPSLPGTKWVFIQAARESVPNQSIDRLLVVPPEPAAGEPVEVIAEVANHSREPVLRRIFLRAGELSLSREVRLDPNARATVIFPFSIAKPGLQLIEVTTDEDAFPADNVRRARVEVAPSLKVWLGGSMADSVSVWSKAFAALDGVDRVDDPNKASVWVFAGWDGSEPGRVREFLARGGGVICQPAPGVTTGQMMAAGVVVGGPESAWNADRLDPPSTLHLTRADHRVFEIFQQGTLGDPAGGRVTWRLRIQPEAFSARDILLAYPDGTPALAMASSGPGLFVLWNIGLENAGEGSLAERVEFVPLVGELVTACRRSSAAETSEISAGETLQFAAGDEVLPDEVRVSGPDGEVGAIPSAGPPTIFLSPRPTSPGFHHWLVGSEVVAVDAVNFAASESDLDPGLAPDMAGAPSVRIGAETPIRDLREGTPLWPMLLAAALALAMAEIAVVWATRPRTS